MIILKSFEIEDFEYLGKWISNESELVQFAGQIFTFPICRNQVELYLADLNRIVFRIENDNFETIGIAEVSIIEENVAKLARILIGDKSMRGKGIGAELINILTEYVFKVLKMEKIILNVYSWNVGAIKCYEKTGFSKTNKAVKIVEFGNEKWETIEMEKKLVGNHIFHKL